MTPTSELQTPRLQAADHSEYICFLVCESGRKQVTLFLPWSIIPYSTLYSFPNSEENLCNKKWERGE